MRIVSISRPQYSKRDCYEENRCRKEFWLPFFGLAILIVLPAARADQSNEATKVTLDSRFRFPDASCRQEPSGSSCPKTLTNTIWSVSTTQIERGCTLSATNAERSRATGSTVFGLAERGSAQPQAIVTRFYASETTGHEFLYPKQVEKEFANAKLVIRSYS